MPSVVATVLSPFIHDLALHYLTLHDLITQLFMIQVLSAFTKKKVQGVKAQGGFNSGDATDAAKSIRCSLKVRVR